MKILFILANKIIIEKLFVIKFILYNIFIISWTSQVIGIILSVKINNLKY